MGENKDDSWIKHYDFIIGDMLFVEIAFYLSFLIRNKFNTYALNDNYTRLFWIIIGLSLVSGFMLDSYARIIRRGYLVELKSVLKYCGFVLIGIIISMFITQTSGEYSRIIIAIMYPVSVLLVYTSRIIRKRIVRKRIIENKETRKIFVISTKDKIKTDINRLNVPYDPYEIEACAVYGEEVKETKIYKVPVVADNRESIIEYVSSHVIDEIFIDIDDEHESRVLSDTFVNMGLVSHQALAPYSFKDEHNKIQPLGGFMVMSSGMNFTTSRQLFFKRILDICGAIVGLILMGISYIIFAPIIKHQSPGPAMFSQVRVGRNGRRFKIYKFRTMYMDAEERKKELMKKNKMDGFMFKMDDDPRIIPIGHFLRKSSIDELPQFWNILKGDMSLVGTRPPTLDEVAHYELHHRKRLAMKPGLTGMWQVSGRSDITDFEEVVALDAKYISEWKLGLDIKILWKTVTQVLCGQGAV